MSNFPSPRSFSPLQVPTLRERLCAAHSATILLLQRRPFEPRPLLPLTVAYIEGKGEHGFLLRHCIPLTIHSPLFHQFSLQENAFFLYSFFLPKRCRLGGRKQEAGNRILFFLSFLFGISSVVVSSSLLLPHAVRAHVLNCPFWIPSSPENPRCDNHPPRPRESLFSLVHIQNRSRQQRLSLKQTRILK